MSVSIEAVAGRVTLNCDSRAIREAVWRIRRDERRQRGWFGHHVYREIPVRRAVYLTPVVVESRIVGQIKEGLPNIVAFTADVSTREIEFAHEEPIGAGQAIATFDREDEEPVLLVIEIERSTNQAGGWHRSRARIIAVTETPDFLCYPRPADRDGTSSPRCLMAHGIKRFEVSDAMRKPGDTHWKRG